MRADSVPAIEDCPQAKARWVVVVGVCTTHCPKMLASCLASIAKQVLPEECDVHLVVVDNEVAASNQNVAKALAQTCPFRVHYIHEPKPGIANARNAVLDRAEELGGDWVAFTDADCIAAPNWLSWLVRTAQWYQSDIIYGCLQYVYPKGKEWLAPKAKSWYEGQPIRSVPTRNMLIKARLFGSDSRLRFDPCLTYGWDTDFSERAFARNARILHSRKPLVIEEVPAERATFLHEVRRAFRYSMNRTRQHRRYDGLARAFARTLRLLGKTPFAALKLALSLIAWPLGPERFKLHVLKQARRLAGTVGSLAGLFGHFGNPGRPVQGH